MLWLQVLSLQLADRVAALTFTAYFALPPSLLLSLLTGYADSEIHHLVGLPQ